MIKLEQKLKKLYFLAIGKILKIYLKIHHCKVGENFKCKQFPIFRTVPFRNITIGNNVNIGYRITFDVENNGELILGDSVNLTQDIIISCKEKVTIGNDTLIAENVSIRDADHGLKKNNLIVKQKMMSSPIWIDEDVWIGAGVKILKGAFLPKGSVFGANSLVTAKTKTNSYGIHIGSPARCVKERI